jgi:hypothetical protein
MQITEPEYQEECCEKDTEHCTRYECNLEVSRGKVYVGMAHGEAV